MKLQLKICGMQLKQYLRGKSVTVNAYMMWRKKEWSQINYLSCHLKKLAKEEETKPKLKRK